VIHCCSCTHTPLLSRLQPKKWTSFWHDNGANEVLSIDMVVENHDLHRILSALTKPPRLAPKRDWCMQCKRIIGTHTRALHCGHCGRLVCNACSNSCLPPEYFPQNFETREPSWVCIICEHVLATRKEENSCETLPTQGTSSYSDGHMSSVFDDEGSERYAC
jgi:hypothetical protein